MVGGRRPAGHSRTSSGPGIDERGAGASPASVEQVAHARRRQSPASDGRGGQAVGVRSCAARSTTTSRPPGRSTRAASASAPPGPRRSAAPSAAPPGRSRRRPAAGGTCRPAAPRSGSAPAGPGGRAPAPASARLASMPSAALIRGASSSSSRPVPVPISSSRPIPAGRPADRAAPARPTAAGSSKRAHLVPVGALAAEAFAGGAGALGQHAGGLAAVGGEHRVVLGQPGQHGARERAGRCPGGQGEPDIGTLARALQQAGLAEQAQMARQPRLRLTEDLGEFHDAERAARGQRQDAQAGSARRRHAAR